MPDGLAPIPHCVRACAMPTQAHYMEVHMQFNRLWPALHDRRRPRRLFRPTLGAHCA